MAVTLIGEHLGGCTLLAELGSGGMATVYRAVRESDGAALAIKIISPKLTVSQQFITRFEREARVMQAFEHPYILPVYEFGQQDGLIYLMMALIEGGDLRDYLNQQRPTLAQIVTLLEQVGSALDYAHDQGVVHRDLKPANILMNGDQPFLSDFGIAKMKEESTGLTESGTLLGTPAYMAPEQWRSEPVNALTDIYALGVMSFEVLAGQLPFNADNPFSLMYRHLDEPPPLLYHLRPDLPVTLDRVIRRAMAKIPEQRYHRASDAMSALREAAGAAVSESRASAALGLLDANTDTDTAVGLDDAAVGLDTAAPHTTPALLTPYDVVDVGARVLLERADEARRELTGTVAVLAQAATSYIQNLRERAKQRGHSLPYRALESYDLSDHHLFYGREAAVDGMLARLPGAKLAVLHAESGAGKTSLIRAGLMPRLLAGGYLPLYVAVRRRLPHEDIKHILWPDPALIPEMASTSLRDYLKMLTQIVGSNREIFIFVDQFETFFSDVFDEAERAACIREIAECLDDPLLPVRLTLALRTESFGLLARFQPQIPQPFANEFLLRPLTPEEARRALIVPAQDKGFAYDESVVDALLQDLGGDGGEIAPPQLQLVGGALIEALPPERKHIELEDYIEAGRAGGVLRGYLERLLERLPADDRQLARRVIESLVRADQSRDVRSFDSVQQEIQAAPEHLERVMTALRENRVLRLYEVDGEIVYELVHDYLARQIELDPQTAARKAAQELLNRRVSDFERYGSLLTAQEFNIVSAQRTQLVLSSSATTLLERTQAQRRRQRRTLIGLITAAVIGLLGAMGGSLLLVQQESSNRQQQLELSLTSEARITTERDTARLSESQMLASLTSEQLSLDPMASLNLALAAVTPLDRPYVPEAEFALSRAVQRSNERLYLPNERPVLGVLWNADETRVLAWNTADVRIFDGQNGALLYTLETSVRPISAMWTGDAVRVVDANGVIFDYDELGAEVQRVETSVEANGAVWSGESAFVWGPNGGLIAGDMLINIAGGPLNGAAWSPDAALLLFYSENQAAVYDAENGNLLARFSGHAERINGAAWRSDNAQIITASDDATAILWDVATGDALLTLADHAEAVTSAGWSPDGSLLVTTGFDGLVILSDANDGTERERLELSNVVDGILWGSEGTRLLAYGEADALALWNITSGEHTSLVGHGDTVVGAAWNADESLLLTYSQDGTALVWDTNGALVASMRGHGATLTSAVFSHNGNRILTSGMDGSARVWDVRENGIIVGEGVEHIYASDAGILEAAWNSDESLLATAHTDGTIRVWEAGTDTPLYTLRGHSDQVRLLAWRPDNRWLLSGSDDGTARVWDINDGTATWVLEGHEGPITAIEWYDEGKRMRTASEDGRVLNWVIDDDTQVFTGFHPRTDGAIWDMQSLDGGNPVIAATVDGHLTVWDLPSGAVIYDIAVSDAPLLGVSVNRDESRYLTWGYDGLAHVIDAQSGEEIVTLRGHADWVIRAVWNHAETQIATVSADGTARVWDAESGAEMQRFEGHSDSVIGVSWNAADTRILTNSVDATARVWDVMSGETVLLLAGHERRIRAAMWNHDETAILTVSDDGTARLWRSWPDLAQLVEFAAARQTRSLTGSQREQFFLSS